MVSGVFICVDAIGVTVSGSDEDASIHGFDRVLVAGLYQPLRRFAGVVGRPDIDPDDLVQEAFVRTLRTRRLDELDDPGAYLRRVILNVAWSQRRRFGRARRMLDMLEASTPVVTDPTYPSDVAELYRLGPKQRAVMFLHDVEGFSFEEVAEMLGMTSSAARMTASRGRRRLRGLLEEEADR
jgi:RNA polymerase sigma-70 factor (ECF subfamily)